MITYKDKTFCNNSQFCTEDCYRRLSEADKENNKYDLPIAMADFTSMDSCTHEKYKNNNSK